MDLPQKEVVAYDSSPDSLPVSVSPRKGVVRPFRGVTV